MSQPSQGSFTRGLGAVVVGLVLAAIVVVLAVVATRSDTAARLQPSISPAVSTVPTASSSATPSSANTIAWADCSKASFGPPLQPLNKPSDVHKYAAVPPMTINTSKLYQMTITTPKGAIVLCLQPDLAPQTVNVMVTLARNDYFNGIPFHRVTQVATDGIGVLQGGDPNCIGHVPAPPATVTGTCGQGGPGFSFNDEPVHQKYVLGAVAMANSGPNTNGSQFFIDTADNSAGLTPSYNIFGKVESGQNVADSLQQGDVMTSVTVREQQ